MVVEQNNHATTIKNVYIVFDLDDWPEIRLRNFTLKIASLVRLIWEKIMIKVSGYRLAFDGKGESNFGNNCTKNAIIIFALKIVYNHTLIIAKIIF